MLSANTLPPPAMGAQCVNMQSSPCEDCVSPELPAPPPPPLQGDLAGARVPDRPMRVRRPLVPSGPVREGLKSPKLRRIGFFRQPAFPAGLTLPDLTACLGFSPGVSEAMSHRGYPSRRTAGCVMAEVGIWGRGNCLWWPGDFLAGSFLLRAVPSRQPQLCPA